MGGGGGVEGLEKREGGRWRGYRGSGRGCRALLKANGDVACCALVSFH